MYTLLVVLIVIAAFLMIGVVLIQESKGGGLSSNFSSSNAIMGVRKTTDFVEKLLGVVQSSWLSSVLQLLMLLQRLKQSRV